MNARPRIFCTSCQRMKSTPISEVRGQADDNEDADIESEASFEQPTAPPPRQVRHTSVKRTAAGDDDVDSEPVPSQRTVKRHVWRLVTSKPFLHALLLALTLIAAVNLSPVPRLITQRVTALQSLPHSEAIIASLLSAILVTATRPPW